MKQNIKLFFHKVFNREYWPFLIVYFPTFFFWAYFSIKAKSFFFFSPSNPGIKNGGMAMESKKEIYDMLPSGIYPKTILVKPGDDFAKIIQQMQENEISFPCIAKPDMGLKGKAVQKINNIDSLKRYLSISHVDSLIQQLIPYLLEAGIFYYRFPGDLQGKISGIVAKEFMIVTGDGKSSTQDLIKRNTRFYLQLEALKKMYGEKLNEILIAGEERNLMPYGNHARGSKFTDETWRVNEKLTKIINDICIKVDGFYFGRMDIKFASWEELEQGKNFSIIELNGAGSEPTHIYDPSHSIFFAWKEIIRHWNIMFKIGRINYKTGTQYMTFAEGIQMLKENNKLIDQLILQSNKLTEN